MTTHLLILKVLLTTACLFGSGINGQLTFSKSWVAGGGKRSSASSSPSITSDSSLSSLPPSPLRSSSATSSSSVLPASAGLTIGSTLADLEDMLASAAAANSQSDGSTYAYSLDAGVGGSGLGRGSSFYPPAPASLEEALTSAGPSSSAAFLSDLMARHKSLHDLLLLTWKTMLKVSVVCVCVVYVRCVPYACHVLISCVSARVRVCDSRVETARRARKA